MQGQGPLSNPAHYIVLATQNKHRFIGVPMGPGFQNCMRLNILVSTDLRKGGILVVYMHFKVVTHWESQF